MMMRPKYYSGLVVDEHGWILDANQHPHTWRKNKGRKTGTLFGENHASDEDSDDNNNNGWMVVMGMAGRIVRLWQTEYGRLSFQEVDPTTKVENVKQASGKRLISIIHCNGRI
jgi:hypothetical protein